MFKKIIALAMTFVMSVGGVVNAYAAVGGENQFVSTNEQGKSTLVIGENKLVAWDNGNEVFVEHYDLNDNLLYTAVSSRDTVDIVTTGVDKTVKKMNAKDFGNTIVKEVNPGMSIMGFNSFSKVATVGVSNIFTQERATMHVYEKMTNRKDTTYTVNKTSTELASIAAAVAVGLVVPSGYAIAIVEALVNAGIGYVSGKIVTILTSTTLSVYRYDLSYYGKDKITADTSPTFNKCGYKYVAKDDLKEWLRGEEYFDGQYYDPEDFTASLSLLDVMTEYLYGVDFSPYEL